MKKENEQVSVELKAYESDDGWYVRLVWAYKNPAHSHPGYDDNQSRLPLSVAEVLFPDSPVVTEAKRRVKERTLKEVNTAENRILSLKKVLQWAENRST